MNRRKHYVFIVSVLFLCLAAPGFLMSHCQVPCGIYDDQMRIHMMEEHVTTIEKAMKQLAANENQNQSVRWVMNKDKHADELTDIVTYYFLAQRIKPDMDHYDDHLKTLHQIMIYSMKSKQTTDLANVEKLKGLIHSFAHSYLGEDHDHSH